MDEPENINTKINFSSETFKKYFTNTSWLFIEKVLKLIISFFVNIYIIRYLGPKDFGILSYAVSFVGLFAAIATLGLDNILVRELVRFPDEKENLLGSAFSLKLLGAVLSILFISITLLIISETKFDVLLIYIISASTIFQTFNVIDLFFQAKVEIKYSAYAQFYALIFSSLIKILLIIAGASLVYFAVITSVEYLLIGMGLIVTYKKRGHKLSRWKFNTNTAIGMLKDSWPLILSGLVIAVYMKIDQVLIKKMLSDSEVGYYAAAVRISEAWYFVPLAICTSLFPAIINAKKVNEIIYFNRLQKLYDILTWLSLIIAVPFTLFSGYIIKVLLGPEYFPSAAVLTIYIWAGIPVFLGVASSQYLINENLTKISFYRTLTGMIINVILNLIFIPLWGIIGSAFATLISYTIATFSIGLSRKTYKQLGMMLKSVFLITFFKYAVNKWQYLWAKK